MPDELQGQENVVEEQPQEEVTASDKPAEEKGEDSQLPEDASERTREQFEKLKQSNKELHDRLRQLEEEKNRPKESVLDSLTPQQQSQLDQLQKDDPQGADDLLNSIVDSNGYVDVALLKKTLSDATQAAQEAKQQASQAVESLRKYTETEQIKVAHQKYPEMDPNSDKFDPRFYDLVKNELVGQLMQGKRDVVSAAEKISQLYKPNVEKKEAEVKKQEVAKQKEQQVRQIGSTGTGTRKPSGYDSMEYDDLMEAARLGKKGAVAALLNRKS